MTYYRLYIRDRSIDGHFIDVVEIDAPDDESAMEIAARHQGWFLELWQEGRRVAAFEPDRSIALLGALDQLHKIHS